MALAAIAVAPSCATTISVPGDFGTIQDAVSHAAKGDTITVGSGTYVENVIIDKAITVTGKDTGSGMPTVDGHGKDGITITTGSVTLQGFRVIDSYNGINVNPSIQNSASKINLIGNKLNNDSYGITGHGYINAAGNDASYNRYDGLNLMDTESDVTGNTADYNGGNGLYLDSSEIRVTGNTAEHNADRGIYLKSDDNTVTGNVARCNYLGISILEGLGNVVQGNMASDNGWAGIYLLTDADNNTITGNTADNNAYVGICLNDKAVSGNTITGNHVYNNSRGGTAVFPWSSFNIVTYDTPEETFNHLFTYDVTAGNNVVKDNIDNAPGPIITPTTQGTDAAGLTAQETGSPSGNPAQQTPASSTTSAGQSLTFVPAVLALVMAGIVAIAADRRRKGGR